MKSTPSTIPTHVAIIMDGNGRWAKLRQHARTAGHVRGAKRTKEIVRAADEVGVKYLTLFAFSSENWSRPPTEVSFLMKLLVKFLEKEAKELKANNVKVSVIGDSGGVPKPAQDTLARLVHETRHNTGLRLNFAFNYGARQEILHAVRQLMVECRSGVTNSEGLSEDLFEKYLYTKDCPDPDLIIRTSGEERISNFLLWQAAYSELYFTPTLWPDFTKDEFLKAIKVYQRRHRRYGGLQTPNSESSTHAPV